MHNKKAAAQFVAAVLLVIITLSIGFFVAQWYGSTVKAEAEEYERKYDTTQKCYNLDISYADPKFNATGNDYFMVYLMNKGATTATLTNIMVYGVNGNYQQYNESYVLAPSQTTVLRLPVNITELQSIDVVSIAIDECGDKVLIIDGDAIIGNP